MRKLFNSLGEPPRMEAVFARVETITDRYGDSQTLETSVSRPGLFAPNNTSGTPPEGISEGPQQDAAFYINEEDLNGFIPNEDDTVEVAGYKWSVEGYPEVWGGAGVVVHLRRFGRGTES